MVNSRQTGGIDAGNGRGGDGTNEERDENLHKSNRQKGARSCAGGVVPTNVRQMEAERTLTYSIEH